jgi:hypothetical protein
VPLDLEVRVRAKGSGAGAGIRIADARGASRDTLEAAVASGEKPGQIQEFFAEVGRGVLAAQQLLDAHTRTYLAGRPPAPGMFRMPKVTAELKLQASRKEQEGILWFFTQSTEAAQTQTISFEIAAAPPPVELLEQYRRFMSLGVLVLDGLTRAELLDSLRNAGQAAAPFAERFPEVLVLSATPGGPPGAGEFILLLAALPGGATDVLVATVGPPGDGGSGKRPVTPLPPLRLAGPLNALWLLASRLGREQASTLPPAIEP